MKMHVTTGDFTMLQILKMEKKFKFNTEYQRSEVWTKKKQQKLVDSILKELSIGMIFLRRRGSKLEVLDGQQRLKTIFKFKKGGFNTSEEFTPEFPNKSYNDLKKELSIYPLFTAFKVNYTMIEGGREDEISEFFLRLQEGVSLNTAERLNATLGEMRKYVIDVSKHKFFKNLDIPNYRFSHRLIAAQIVLLELEKNFDEFNFPDLRRNNLLSMYIENKTNVPKWVKLRVKRNLNFLYKSLKKDTKIFSRKTDIPMLYIVASYLTGKYVVSSNKLNEFVVDFYTKTAEVNRGEKIKNGKLYSNYNKWSKHGLTSEAFKNKFKLLVKAFEIKNPRLTSKTNKRLFDENQKILIYYKKNKGICQYDKCKKKVNWKVASFHHRKFHRSGGPTTVRNGQLMHKKCHIEFHKIKGKDDDV